MKNEQDYIQDLSEIRAMMERSSKFMSLSGMAGVMAGVYALIATYLAFTLYGFNPTELQQGSEIRSHESIWSVIALAISVLVLSITTAIYLSYKKAKQKGEKAWNAASRRLLSFMAAPLIAGGLFTLILFSNGLIGLLAPTTLLFYGLALYNAGKFTFVEVKNLGIIQIILGLLSACYLEYSLLIWALGFGVMHIIYGVYMHFKYER